MFTNIKINLLATPPKCCTGQLHPAGWRPRGSVLLGPFFLEIAYHLHSLNNTADGKTQWLRCPGRKVVYAISLVHVKQELCSI